MESDLLKEIKSTIKALIISSPNDLTLEKLNKDYVDTVGENIPYRKMGYLSLETFLNSMPDSVQIYKLSGRIYVKNVASNKTSHIEQLVQGQRKLPNKRNNKFNRRNMQGYTQQRNTNFGNPCLPKTSNNNMDMLMAANMACGQPMQRPQCNFPKNKNWNVNYNPSFTSHNLQPRYQSREQKHPRNKSDNISKGFQQTNYHFQGIEESGKQKHSNIFCNQIKSSLQTPAPLPRPTATSQLPQKSDQKKEKAISKQQNNAELRNKSPSIIDRFNNFFFKFGKTQSKKAINDNVDKGTSQDKQAVFNSKLSSTRGTASQKTFQHNTVEQIRPATKILTGTKESKKDINKLKDQSLQNNRMFQAAEHSNFLSKVQPSLKQQKQEVSISNNNAIFSTANQKNINESLTSVFRGVGGKLENLSLDEKSIKESNNDSLKESYGESNSESLTHYDDFDDAVPRFALTSDIFLLDFPENTATFGMNFTLMTLPAVNSIIPLYTTNIISPDLFYYHIRDAMEDFDTLTSSIQYFYNALDFNKYKIPIHCIKNGQICAANVNGTWQRGIIRGSKYVKQHQVIVYLVDSAYEILLRQGEIKFLDINFVDLPAQCLIGCLHGLQPQYDDKWTSSAIQLFRNFAIDRILYGKVVAIDKQKNKCSIVICDSNGRNFNDILIREGHAVNRM